MLDRVGDNVPVGCIICQAHELHYLFTPPNSPGDVMRCTNCGFVFIPNITNSRAIISSGPVMGKLPRTARTSRNIKDLEGSWELPFIRHKEREFPAMRLNTRKAIERLEMYAQPGPILDFGCGTGIQLKVACEMGWQGQGLEPLTGHSIYARAHFDLPVINDVLHDDSFGPESFNAITAYQVFEHLPDPVHTMQQLVKALKPGGALLVEVPNIDNLLSRIMGPRHRHFVIDHLNFFSAATLSRLMEDSGLKVVSVHYPARSMSIQHLVDWIYHLMPATKPLHWLGNRPWLANRIVSVTLHDIIEVIGVKPGS